VWTFSHYPKIHFRHIFQSLNEVSSRNLIPYPRSFSSYSIAANNPSLSDSRNPFVKAKVTLSFTLCTTVTRVDVALERLQLTSAATSPTT
jgi:hypothetical protein